MANGSDSRPKRTFKAIRTSIMSALSHGQQTINQVAAKTGINWRTVELHLNYLSGRGLTKEIFSSQYVRIFILTEKGKEALKDEVEKLMEQVIIKQPENSVSGKKRADLSDVVSGMAVEKELQEAEQ